MATLNTKAMVIVHSKNFGAVSFNFPNAKGGYVGTVSTFVDGGRNLRGEYIGGVIRDGVGKVEISYNVIKAEDWAHMLQCFSIEHGGAYVNNVEFFSTVHDAWITRKMYVSGDRTDSGALFLEDNSSSPRYGKPKYYQGARLALIGA